MDFLEYVAAINLVLREKLEDKLQWSFKVFDSDDNGRLDGQELRKIVKVKSVDFLKSQCLQNCLITSVFMWLQVGNYHYIIYWLCI